MYNRSYSRNESQVIITRGSKEKEGKKEKRNGKKKSNLQLQGKKGDEAGVLTPYFSRIGPV